ncbi:MAG: DNA primase [Armatimonadota bacterium]|nr:DNA primase [Armatimonadota bacterium]
MPDDRDLIRSRIDLVDLVGERVKLTRSGKKWKGLCPFHAEKTPSFYVDSDLQLFHCFGCKKGGDIFGWVIESEGVDFREALEMLAAKTGVELSGGRAKPDETRRRLEIMEEALAFFREAYRKTEKTRTYAEKRGLDAATVDIWQIGFAPSSEYELGTYLGKKKHSLRDAEELSLLTSTSSGYLDFFRNRLMFPIRDEQGRLVAFSGRSMDGTEPKYINSRESPLFHKGSVLFGLHLARPLLKDSRRAVLVEGQMDVIACQRAAVPAVAPLGTALTEAQAQKLKRSCDEVVVFYDGDHAGRAAAEKAFEMLGTVGIRRSAVVVGAGEDPDTILDDKGPEHLRNLTENRVSPLRYRIAWLMREHGAKPGIASPEFWEAVETNLARSRHLLEVDAIIDELSAYHPNAKVDRLNVVRSLRAQVAARTKDREAGKTTVTIQGTLAKPRGPERLILLAALDPEFRSGAWPMLGEHDLIVSSGGRFLADALLNYSAEAPTASRSDIANGLEEESRTAIIALDATIDPMGDDILLLSDSAIQGAYEILLKEKARRQRLSRYTADQKAETLEKMYGESSTEQGE